MSLVIPGLPKRQMRLPDPSQPNSGFSPGGRRFAGEEGGVEQEDNPVSQATRDKWGDGFKYGTAGPRTDDPSARGRVLSGGYQDQGMDFIPEPQGSPTGDYLSVMSRDATNQAIGGANDLQVSQTEAADQRRREAIEYEAQQIKQQQQLEAGEAARMFEQKYGVPYDKDSAKFVMEAEKAQTIEDDYNQAVSILQSYLASGMDSLGKPYTQKRYADDLKTLGISRGMKARAPEGYFRAIAPPDPYGLQGAVDSPVAQSLPTS